ncbi:peptidase domain-containing protein [Scytonema sp. HK-05]|uniref:hypothetical protein n=1 Tax=Scytonema sp. HK-05 TaxID=1137095 RepID=UPI000935BD41|nr:hypothetical protein [Scytonema sp. HK-05]OKH57258.1 hypothetical protein NIES2130_20675 [Scytonema sp. HK-05]BAY48624.1 peptidase domain-containing protein [Scytonema sp. HK-05]
MTYFPIGNIGSTPITRSDSVNSANPTDIYRIDLTSTSNINLALTNINGGDADLSLYRDTNGDGGLDLGVDQLVPGGSSARGGNFDDSINVADQPLGTYFARVNLFSGSNVSYRLSMSTADPSNLLPIEENLGDLSADISRTGEVGNNDTSDTYAFSIGYFEGVNINLSGLSSDADIRLIADTNGNRIVDSGETLLSSTRGSTNSESISLDDAGNYLLQVYQFSGSTNYTLGFDHFSSGLALAAVG